MGLERAIPNSETIWQCEKDSFCQKILKKHWPHAKLYTDITKMDTAEVQRPDILVGGFPCTDISIAGKGVGIHGKKSGLYWHMYALISRFRPSIVVLENVPAINFRGGREVLESLAAIRYDAEWTTISAKEQGACHLRRRWFCVAYPHRKSKPTHAHSRRRKKHTFAAKPTHGQTCKMSEHSIGRDRRSENYWQTVPNPPPLCRVDDGIPNRLARLKALGNAIVPQCSEYIGRCIVQSGLLDELT